MQNKTVYKFDIAVICVILCLSLTLWCQILYLLGYEDGETALLSLFDIPLLLFYAPFIRGSQLAAIAIGVTMVGTGVIWAHYLQQVVAEAINGQKQIGHFLLMPLFTSIILMKMTMAYTCLLSPSFREVLLDVRRNYLK